EQSAQPAAVRRLEPAWFSRACSSLAFSGQSVRFTRELVCESARHAPRIAHADDVTRDQPRQVIRVHPAREVVTRGNAAEGTRVIVEARSIPDGSRLGRLRAKTSHA